MQFFSIALKTKERTEIELEKKGFYGKNCEPVKEFNFMSTLTVTPTKRTNTYINV